MLRTVVVVAVEAHAVVPTLTPTAAASYQNL